TVYQTTNCHRSPTLTSGAEALCAAASQASNAAIATARATCDMRPPGYSSARQTIDGFLQHLDRVRAALAGQFSLIDDQKQAVLFLADHASLQPAAVVQSYDAIGFDRPRKPFHRDRARFLREHDVFY